MCKYPKMDLKNQPLLYLKTTLFRKPNEVMPCNPALRLYYINLLLKMYVRNACVIRVDQRHDKKK